MSALPVDEQRLAQAEREKSLGFEARLFVRLGIKGGENALGDEFLDRDEFHRAEIGLIFAAQILALDHGIAGELDGGIGHFPLPHLAGAVELFAENFLQDARGETARVRGEEEFFPARSCC